MIDHNVMRLHIPVHDALAMAKVKSLEQLEYIKPHIEVVELRIKATEIDIVNVFEN